MPSGWQIGISLVVLVVTAFLVGTLTMDIHYHLKGEPSVALRLQRWSRRYPYLSLFLIFFYGALMAHLFINTGWGTP